jgi:hypothetical protein
MHKLILIVIAVAALSATSCVTTQQQEQKQQAAPVITKYDKMEQKDLKEELKRLQAEVLVAERAAKQAKEKAGEAAKAYKSASDDDKPVTLLRMIEADAVSRKPIEQYKQVRSDFTAAKCAYHNMLLAH